MIFKLRQRLHVPHLTRGNRVPNIRSKKFLINYLRYRQETGSLLNRRIAVGVVHWMVTNIRRNETRISHRAQCFLTGRSRGTTQRFTVARTKIKAIAALLFLPGVRKGSW